METSIKMKLKDLIDCDYEEYVHGISHMAKDVSRGWLFAALRGIRGNGEDHIGSAILHGAKFILKYGEKYRVYREKNCFFIEDPEPRKLLAEICAKFYAHKLSKLVAVTGTNGKTSTCDFLRQVWEKCGKKAANVGTLGVVSSANSDIKPSMTCPEPISLNKTLLNLSLSGVENVAIEASSHGIDQHRIDGLNFDVLAFTNLSQDHLDYHKNMDEYWSVKRKLFTKYVNDKTVCVVNADSEKFDELYKICKGKIISYGLEKGDVRFADIRKKGDGYLAKFVFFDCEYSVKINIFSRFQLYNILCAVCMAYASGCEILPIVNAIPFLRDVKGRMQFAGSVNGGNIYVDYAHTPDGLFTALKDLRTHTEGRLIVVFGCGGDRDASKRAEMGRIAASEADIVIVTDDNPRTEDPLSIRQEILSGCPNAIEIGDRHEAISRAIDFVKEGDNLLIAGKGHENYQIIGKEICHFDDVEEVQKNIRVFSSDELSKIFDRYVKNDVMRISLDSRDVRPGDLFVAIKGENFDGNDFVDMAISKGANAVLCSRYVGDSKNVILVDDTLQALQNLGIYARNRINSNVIGITGSVGKTSTRNMLSLVLGRFSPTFSSVKNYNSQIGLPICLSMVRQNIENCILEMGMSQPGDLVKLTKIARQDISIITNISANHCEFFASPDDIAMAKSEIFSNGEDQKFAIVPLIDKYGDLLIRQAHEQKIKEVFTFGNKSDCHAYIKNVDIFDGMAKIEANILGEKVDYLLYSVNFGLIIDNLIPLLCSRLLGNNLTESADELSKFKPLSGRGNVINLPKNSLIIDDTYNAGPSSMIAAIKSLESYKNMRKIAILGDMGELGNQSENFHKSLFEPLSCVEKAYLCGENMRALYGLDRDKFRWYETVDELIKSLKFEENCVYLVKASRFMKFEKIVNFLKEI